jgi:hypothetical protein
MIGFSQVNGRPFTEYNPPSNVESYLQQFFSQYPGFRFDPNLPSTEQFRTMCRLKGWNSSERKDAYEGFADAMSQSFNNMYGTEVQDLWSWQTLCMVLEIEPVPNRLEECQDVSTVAPKMTMAIPLNTQNYRPSSRRTLTLPI